jgi:hypothetical protein
MIRLLELQERLRDTSAAMAELERASVKEPNSPSLMVMAESLRKRKSVLDSEYSTEADSLGIDICTYRIFGEHDHQTLRALVQTLGDFQSLVSTVYDAVKSKVPKMRARMSADVVAETEFGFGYIFPGSVGVVLTIPNQRLLGIESELDESILGISSMAKAKDPAEVLQYAKKFGGASIRALYRWAYDHDELGLGASIEWKRNQVIRSHLLTQQPELKRLHETIGMTSEEIITELEINGTLVGAEVTRKTFHILLDNGENIRGSFQDAISEAQTAELPSRYRAFIVKREQIKYSTEEPIVSYDLNKLERIQP